MTIEPVGIAVDDVNQRISENAMTLMFRMKWTKRDLARAIGVGDNTIGRRLAGVREWTAYELVAMSKATYVTLDQLTGELPDFHEWCAIKGSNLGPTDMEHGPAVSPFGNCPQCGEPRSAGDNECPRCWRTAGVIAYLADYRSEVVA